MRDYNSLYEIIIGYKKLLEIFGKNIINYK